MKLNEARFDEGLPIDGYGPGFFRVAGEVIDGAVLVGPEGTAPWGGLSDTAPLHALAGKVDVLFIGTGADTAHLPADLAETLRDQGVNAEGMASGPAARTYNVLLSEGRRVAAALLPV